ncbi:Metallo-dependent phosphatase-like protein [Russula emetica]|nr:Metallo-dependent phosphatase-like protein [Russula emetica]
MRVLPVRVPRYSLRAVRTAWIAIILWLEIGIFVAAGVRCRWPNPGVVRENGKAATHILLVADPQILDERSYPGRSSLLRSVSRIFVDMNLRKAWRVAKRKRPHAIIFLGDMMDNGFADMHITEYQENVRRFHSIFPAPPSVPLYYIPGNHDVGLGDRRNMSSLARPRYRSAFGPLTQHVKLGGHSLFMIDAPALVDEDLRREDAGKKGSVNGLPQDLEYLQHMRAGQVANTPLILFSHIPLYRPSDSNCGPLREKGIIPYVRGDGYQTLLSPETSRLLLDELSPTVIFSGDDHDYCEYIHTSHERRIPEVTIKSLSIAMGIRQPGFQLLSLSSKTSTHAYQLCLLPDQVRIYCWVYAPLVLATIVLVTARALTNAPSNYQKHIQKRSDLLPYSASLQQPRPPHRRSYYRLRVAKDLWAVTWPSLGVYMVTAFVAFW